MLLWDMRHLETPVAECANPGAVHALAFVDDLVVSAGADGRLRAHAAKDLTVEASASVLNSILCVKAEGSRVASAGGTGKTISDAGIQLWRVAVEGGEPAVAGPTETRAEKRRKRDGGGGG